MKISSNDLPAAIVERIRHDNARPLTLPEIRKQGNARPADYRAALAWLVESGRLTEWPAGYYWDSDPIGPLTTVILKTAADAAQPLTLKQFVDALPFHKAAKAVKGAVESLLDNLAAGSRLWKWPGKQGYWVRDPASHARAALLEAASAGACSETVLARKLKAKLPRSKPKELIRQALVRGDLLYAGKPPLLFTKEQLWEELRRAFAQSGQTPPEAPAPPADAATIARVFEEIEPRTNVLFPLARLRAAPALAAFGKRRFDEGVLALFSRHQVMLHEHHAPHTLTEVERNELVFDGGERYYVGICWYGA
jgi:hypothetical protein